MGALDDIEAALRARTGKRVYGTPFYEQKLAELEQAQQGRDIGNQQAALDLEQAKALGPVKLRAAEAAIPIKEATARKVGAEADIKEHQATPEYQQALADREDAKLAMTQAKNANELLTAQQKVRESERRIKFMDEKAAHLGDKSAGGLPTFFPGGAEGPLLIDRKTGTSSRVMSPEGKPLGPKPTAASQAAVEAHKSAVQGLDALDAALSRYEKARSSGNLKEAAIALGSYNAQLQLLGNTLGRASGDTRIGDKERPVYARVAGVTSTLANIADPSIARARLNNAREFLNSIKPKSAGSDDNDPLGIR